MKEAIGGAAHGVHDQIVTTIYWGNTCTTGQKLWRENTKRCKNTVGEERDVHYRGCVLEGLSCHHVTCARATLQHAKEEGNGLLAVLGGV